MPIQYNVQLLINALNQGYLGAGVPGPIETPDGDKNPAATMASGVGNAINAQIGNALIQLSNEIAVLTATVADLETQVASLSAQVTGLGEDVESLEGQIGGTAGGQGVP